MIKDIALLQNDLTHSIIMPTDSDCVFGIFIKQWCTLSQERCWSTKLVAEIIN